METLLGLLVIAVAVVILLRRWRSAQARTNEISDLAVEKGWAFNLNEPTLVDRWPGDPFGLGEEQRARNVVRGQWGDRKFIAFDYSYQPFSLRSGKAPHRFSVVSMQLPAELPFLEVEHENLLGENVRNAIGTAKDVRFESEAFNRTFRITASDERYARAVIHPRVMELLLDRGEIGWRIVGNDLLGWDTGSHTGTDLFRRLDLLDQVADLIPNFVYRDYGQPGG